MLILVLVFVLSFGTPAPLFSYVSPVSYSDAQDQLAGLASEAAAAHAEMRLKIQAQAANYEVLNRLRQAKITVDEMIQRDNIAKACKVADLAATAVVITVTAGTGVIAKEGGKAALKWVVKQVAKEGAKEALGVPGYSDVVKIGVYIFNKADQRDLAGQLSRDNIAALAQAQRLIQDESDGRTLLDKRPEFIQLVLEAENTVETADRELRNIAAQMDELQKKGDFLNKEAEKRREEQKKTSEKNAERMKQIEASNLVNTELNKPAQVPTPAADPKDTAEEKRRKMQEAISKYINTLSSRIGSDKKSADAAWSALNKPQTNTRFDATDEIKDLLNALISLEGQLTESSTYAFLQGIENSARTSAENIKNNRARYETYKSDIKSKMEPLITSISGYTAQWKSAHDIYTPQGFYVSEPEKLKSMMLWTSYYVAPLTYIEIYLKGTEGLDAKFAELAAKAAARKDSIYSDARSLAESYSVKLQGFKDYKPQIVSQLDGINTKLAGKNDIVYSLPGAFVNEFAYDGKYDLSELEAKMAAARPAFSEAQKLYEGGVLLYQDLLGKYRELTAMSAMPLMDEARNIAYMADNKAHRDAMSSAIKKTGQYSPDMTGTEGWQQDRSSGAEIMFGAEEALKYLKVQSGKLVAAYAKAITDFKAGIAKDLSYLETLDAQRYGAEIEKLFAPAQIVESEKQKIIEQTRKAPLFGTGTKPLLETVGFWTKQAGVKRDEFEKLTSAFWESPAGKRLSGARRNTELQENREKGDPGLAVVKKMYEGFKSAYESRNAARVMSFISDDWSAGDGTTVSDLDEQFTRIFRVYDEISVDITNLQIVSEGAGKYMVSYNMAIRSKIYKKNIKREESSSVSEHLVISGSSAKITKTEAGGYWDIK